MSGGGVFQDGVLVGIHTHGDPGGGVGFAIGLVSSQSCGPLGCRESGLIDRVVDRQVGRVKADLEESTTPSKGEIVSAILGAAASWWYQSRQSASIVSVRRKAVK
jgi:hypothetical protein